jgi:formylglycine-generating enzyme
MAKRVDPGAVVGRGHSRAGPNPHWGPFSWRADMVFKELLKPRDRAVSPAANAPRARLLPLPPVFPCAWAAAYGEDSFGLWQAFDVAGVRQVLRWLPPGKFIMGSPLTESERDDSEVQHSVEFTAGHWLADTACTQALWVAVMGQANRSRFTNDSENPVENVSWLDVVNDFLPRLNAQVPGLNAVLPTEALWEYACRADTEQSTPFSFGEHINSEQVNFDGNFPMAGSAKSAYRQQTVPVKALPRNSWGLYQMHGNVFEWCADWLVPYAKDAVVDPTGPLETPVKGAGRVLRGGSWLYDARYCRSAQRDASVPDDRGGSMGFRLARGAS